MAYITTYNASSIIYKTEINSIDTSEELYLKNIYIFNEYEKKQLLAYKELVRDTEKFIKEMYKPIELKEDSFRFVNEYKNQKPAYHLDLDCPRLNADYENYTIPDSIRKNDDGSLNKERIIAFRKWFKSVQDLFKRDKVAFVARLELKWHIKENPLGLEADNSGIEDIVNYDIEELIEKIDDLISKAGKFFYASPKNTAILRPFGRLSFLAYKHDPIYDNNTEYDDNEVKQFLRDYDKTYKKPLKILLKEYYRLKYNPDLQMDGILLDRLNFNPCHYCLEHSDSPVVEKIDINRGQFAKHAKSIEMPEHVKDHEEFFNSRYR